MDATEALLIAEHPARHDMPPLWAALRVLAPIVRRARIARGAQWVADEDRYVVNYILDNTIPAAGVAVQED